MKNTTCLLLLFCANLAMSQSLQQPAPERQAGEILVQLDAGADLEIVLAELNRQSGSAFSVKKAIAKNWGMYALQFAENQENGERMLGIAQRTPGIRAAQWNSKVSERSLEPNDPEWWRQGDMTLIGAPEVWETSTGGLTFRGDTIVVAVLEKGALFTHPDLAPNRWWNWDEKPNNGIDDDGNGFVDDFGGWNPATETDDLGNKGNHGTAVCGIVGARGNNSEGVTGVNWNVKLMTINGASFESDIIEGFEYAGNMRRIYNITNGAKGAFVVATNASFGFDYGKPVDHPLWCAVYDSLGKVGVLNVAATINDNVDVDVVGDIPTTCPSEFLISVTNITKSGIKYPIAGYGSVSIDLGAPGQDTYTTNAGTNDTPTYGSTIGGCSAAAPHVTGGIALLYSLGCEPFTSDAITDPVACVRRVRDVILNNTAPNASLSGITVFGGHLDLGSALEAVRELCDGATVGSLDFLEVRTSQDGDHLRVFYQTPNFTAYNLRIFNMLGQQLYEQKLQPQQFSENYVDLDISNLPRAVYVMSIGRGNAVKSRKFPKI